MKSNRLAGIICFILFSCTTNAQTDSSGPQIQIKTATKMKEFILLVRVPLTYTREKAEEVNPKWEIVLRNWKAENVFVTSFAFPQESYVLSGADRSVKKESVVSQNLRVVSSIILRAGNLENAVELAKVCPILEHGGTVEIREIVSRSTQPAK